jgi:hypothetical protein
MCPVICPLCRERKARRACPALDQQICSVCCGTKRLSEIRCPPDCGYLATARTHPPAAAIRQQRHDVDVLLPLVRDLNEGQSELFVIAATFLRSYKPGDLETLTDADAAQAFGALAATFETASKGIIYEHRPPSGTAARLLAGLKEALAAGVNRQGSAFERDAAVVLRRLEKAAAEVGAEAPDNPRAFLELVARLMNRQRLESAEEPGPEAQRLIVP